MIFFNENKIRKIRIHSGHRKLTLKVRILQIATDNQKQFVSKKNICSEFTHLLPSMC